MKTRHRRLDHALLVLAFAALSGAAVVTATAAENAAASEDRLRQTVAFLASDALEGRGVGTAGLNKAAEFLAEQFSRMGLKTDLFGGTPFQEFEETLASEMGPRESNRMMLVGPPANDGQPRKVELKLGESFSPLAASGSGRFDAPLVFAGYGITAKNLKRGDQPFAYDDYAGIDAAGKVVIVLRKEPQQDDKQSPFNGQQPSQYAPFAKKIENAADHGAAAVIFVNDGPELSKRREESVRLLRAALDELAQQRDKLAALQAGDTGLESLTAKVQKAAAEAAELAKTLASGTDALLPFTGAGETGRHPKLPVYFCTRAAIDSVVSSAGGKNLAALETEIDGDLAPRSFALTGWRATGEARVIEKTTQIKNVVGVLDGAGPLADETIVVGAHYDHLGLGGANSGSLAPWTIDIHNGADDNASGAATLLEVAQRLSTRPKKPRRRIVFIAFTGEERGLLGSARYTREPRFPLEKTIAMFNLDMVGRLNDDKLDVYGTGTAKEFDPLVERLSQEHGFKLSKHAGGFGPSDHSSFYSKKIPVLHLFTGSHTDYHRPSDDTDKLNITGMRRVADILVDLIQATDSTEMRPSYVEIRRVEVLGGDRPSFGSMPAYPNPVKDGVLLEMVRENTPADKAGIKGGDVLVKFGDYKITVLEDFQNALVQHKPGDQVKVTVRRGQEVIELDVTLARSQAMP
jgi:Peptidase family M28/PDZ domain/PA domain